MEIRSIGKRGGGVAIDRTLYIILGGPRCDTIAPTEDESDIMKYCFCEELVLVFDKFPKCHLRILTN
jgi:hypothetical protein